MPELPEVHTTVTILNKIIVGKKIVDAWSDYNSSFYVGKGNIKDPAYFKLFRKKICGKKIQKVFRRGKNILISLDENLTILIHMKMTGHLLHGKYMYTKQPEAIKNQRLQKVWRAIEEGPLQDPFNQFIHFVLVFSDNTHLAFSDMRKFATVKLLESREEFDIELSHLGPEPLHDTYIWIDLKKSLSKRPKQKIKTALMDQSLVVGIGNIYSDEMLWSAGVHPERPVETISNSEFKKMMTAGKNVLRAGIDFGGDSMSDYRNPHGLPGDFQNQHNAYRRTKQPCSKKSCVGIITRKVVNGRSAHFCPTHQK